MHILEYTCNSETKLFHLCFSNQKVFSRLCLGCSINRYFEPTFTFMGLLLCRLICQAIIAQWKAEKVAADTHLAWLGVKIARNGILGITFLQKLFESTKEYYKVQKRRSCRKAAPYFFIIDLGVGHTIKYS